MDPDTTPRPSYRAAFKATAASSMWKLAIVIAGVGAYYGLNSMEKTKSRYEQAKNVPIVIVDAVTTKNENPATRSAIELRASDVKARFRREEVKPYTDRVKHQPFVNADALISRINEEILKEQLSEERVILQQSEVIAKEYNAKKYALQTRRTEECELQLETKAPRADQKFAHKKRTRTVENKPTDICSETAEMIINRNHDNQIRLLNEDFDRINKRTQERIRSVYEDLKPWLSERLGEESRKLPISSFAYLFPSSVLDQKNGSHVIYNIFWLTCMVVLVFGVLFIILLLLRPLPPFAGGTEALTEQAKSFLSKRGAAATPELARTVIVTTAALGVGTAVAVAGGMNMGGSTARNLEIGWDGTRPPYQYAINDERRLPKSFPGPSPEIIVNTPVTVPPPMTVQIHTSDSTSVRALTETVDKFNGDLKALDSNVGTLKDQVMQINNGYIGDVSRISQSVNKLENDQSALETEVYATRDRLTHLQGQADVFTGDVLMRLGVAGDAMDGLRRDNVTRLHPTNRSFFSRVKNIFSSGDQRYMVTNQSYMALESSLCAISYGPRDLNTFSDSDRPDRCDLTSPCSRNVKCFDPTLGPILERLKGLIEKGPMTEAVLMNALTNQGTPQIDKDALKKWRPVIFRYLQISY